MFDFNLGSGSDSKAVLEALGRSLAIIEFDPTGKILIGEREFLHGDGLRPRGNQRPAPQHVRRTRLCPQRRNTGSSGPSSAAANSTRAEYKRIGKGGREVWIQASYNPVKNSKGTVLKVVKARDRHHRGETQERRIRRQDQCDLARSGGHRIHACRRNHHRQREFPEHSRLSSRGNQGPASSHLRRAGLRAILRLSGVLEETEPRRIYRGRVQAHRQGRQGGLDSGLLQPDFRPEQQGDEGRQIRDRRHRAVAAVNEIGAGLSRLAERDLEHRIDKSFSPAFEKLRLDFNLSLEKLQATLAADR